MTPILVALGSNLGDRRDHIRRAVARLGCLFSEIRLSSLYATEPMYVADQPEFLNAALSAQTDLSPRQTLRTLKDVESEVGRVPRERNGPREIDLDLVAYGSLAYRFVEDDRVVLELPHPRSPERRFVLEPAFEVAPDFELPGLGTIRALLAATECGPNCVKILKDAAVPLSGHG